MAESGWRLRVPSRNFAVWPRGCPGGRIIVTAGIASNVLLDSSSWLEYITLDTKADAVVPYLQGDRPVIVPTIVIYEVYKKLKLSWGKTEADRFASQAMRQHVVPMDEVLALAAANNSLQL